MTRTIDPPGISKNAVRRVLALIALLPLAACGAGTFAQDPFGDAAEACRDRHGTWQPGCATRRNIAALAEHSADLDKPRGEAPGDSVRRDALISGFARGSTSGESRGSGQPALTSGGRKEP